MNKIKLVVFDLSGTTVEDNNAVAISLFEAAKEYGLNATLADFEQTIGTNKIHLYQFLIARGQGKSVHIANLEQYNFPEIQAEAHKIFERYSEIMIDYYRRNIQAMPEAEAVFDWCHQNNIKVATDTGFHRDVTEAIMSGLRWKERGLVDIVVDVENTGGIGRPTPFLIFYAMQKLGIQSVHEVIKIGDTPADLLSGYNAGCRGNIGVLSGANSIEVLGKYRHTHILPSVKELPELILTDFN